MFMLEFDVSTRYDTSMKRAITTLSLTVGLAFTGPETPDLFASTLPAHAVPEFCKEELFDAFDNVSSVEKALLEDKITSVEVDESTGSERKEELREDEEKSEAIKAYPSINEMKSRMSHQGSFLLERSGITLQVYSEYPWRIDGDAQEYLLDNALRAPTDSSSSIERIVNPCKSRGLFDDARLSGLVRKVYVFGDGDKDDVCIADQTVVPISIGLCTAGGRMRNGIFSEEIYVAPTSTNELTPNQRASSILTHELEHLTNLHFDAPGPTEKDRDYTAEIVQDAAEVEIKDGHVSLHLEE